MIETLYKGGYMMVPLILCSVLAVTVLIDRALAFYKNRQIDNRSLRARVMELLSQGRLNEAIELCDSTPSPVSAVLMVGLQSYRKHRALSKRPEAITSIMEESMDDYSIHAMSNVEKRLGVLSTIGNAAPLLGMTGTVLGMITTFETLSSMKGMDIQALGVGIAEALITTAAGLLIALLAVIPYRMFTSMADRIDLEIEESRSELLDFVATQMETAE
ncbi:MAG: MotA/TolQ/ExbB proton channel family protein [Phycisphaerae bacterium]